MQFSHNDMQTLDMVLFVGMPISCFVVLLWLQVFHVTIRILQHSQPIILHEIDNEM